VVAKLLAANRGNMRHSREEIGAILAQRLERAETVWRQEQARFAGIVADIPSGLPHPDGVARIKIAADRHNRSLRNYRTALNEFRAFFVDGLVPDRFEE
jgi:hypothetical protein